MVEQKLETLRTLTAQSLKQSTNMCCNYLKMVSEKGSDVYSVCEEQVLSGA